MIFGVCSSDGLSEREAAAIAGIEVREVPCPSRKCPLTTERLKEIYHVLRNHKPWWQVVA